MSENRPQAYVLYESMFGNTEQIAMAVAEGLREAGYEVKTGDVAWAPIGDPLESDLLVVGAPTHAFSLSRPATRRSAVDQGAPHVRQGVGLREWLSRLRTEPGTRLPAVAVFDTRVPKAQRLPGATRAAVRLARRDGFSVVADPETFFVADSPGPLVEGEQARARAWGRTLATTALPAPHGTDHRAAS
ncbi:MAG TPA: flavodoxin domain-containing protein [Nocardioides sp.]|nr:flavodoxin domain-containing protein [Nocardioides sp.]